MCKKNVIKTNNKKIVIDFGNISYITTFDSGCKLIFYNGEQKKLNHVSLKKIYGEVKEDGFIRCHKSYLVNIDYIKSLQYSKLTLLDDSVIPIGRYYGKEVKNIFNVI